MSDKPKIYFNGIDGSTGKYLLPPMTAAQATIFVEQERREKAIAWLRVVREWIRTHT